MAERKHDPVQATGREHRFQPSDPDHGSTLSAAQIRHYNEQGYISPLDVFDAEEATRNRAYIDDLLRQVLEADDKRNAYSINTYHMVCAGLWDLVTEPRIVAMVTDLLGEEAVCWGSHLFAKLPGDPKAVPFHQDAIYWPLTPSKKRSRSGWPSMIRTRRTLPCSSSPAVICKARWNISPEVWTERGCWVVRPSAWMHFRIGS